MFLFYVRKQSLAVAAAVIACFVASGEMRAQNTTKLPNVTYSASGTFSGTPVSGSDLFRLAGNPFDINVIGNEAMKPKKFTKSYAVYTDLKLVGHVQSSLLTTPTKIASRHVFAVLSIGPKGDTLELTAPVEAVGEAITIHAVIVMPSGTFGKGWRIYPFTNSASIGPATGTVTYSNKTDSTELSIASGTVNAVKGAK